MKGAVLSLLVSVFLLLSAGSCRERYQKISISGEKLIPLLCDIHISEAALQGVYGSKKDSLNELYLSQICEIHQINRDQINTILEELRNNPDAMKKAYLAVAQELERRKQPQ